MIWLIAAIVGGIIGLIYGFGVSTDRRLNTFLNILLGIVGGILGIWFFFSVLGIATASVVWNFWLAILWSIIGAVVFMAIIDAIVAVSARGAERRTYEEHRMHERGVAHEYEEMPKEGEEEEVHRIHRRRKGR